MNRFRRILVGISDTNHGGTALEQAAAMARATGASLTLAHAIEPPGRLFRAVYPQADELHSVLQRGVSERLKELAAPFQAEGLTVSTRLLEGKAFLALCQEVLRSSHDLLVKPAEAPSEASVLGSTDMHLLRKCPCAVWITNESAIPASRVLALIDPDPANAELNQRILQVAASIGESRNAIVDVLHAWEANGADLLKGRLASEELREYVEETRERSAREMSTALADSELSFPEQRIHLVSGDVRRVVPEFVQKQEIGLVVMGTVCRTGIQGFLIGNTAEAILSSVRCPVLTLKPRGFVSPVGLIQ